MPWPVQADDSDLCLLAALNASPLSGVPLAVLQAVTLTETGRGRGADTRPWAVDMDDEGHWFPTREEAPAFAEARHAEGADSFDIGCFQINWRWHHESFVSIDQMFDPPANSSHAAGFLNDLSEKAGSWSEAAGAFHSRAPEHSARYRALYDSHYATAVAAGADQGRLRCQPAPLGTLLVQGATPIPDLARVNTFPLLQPTGGTTRLGSLVPLGDG